MSNLIKFMGDDCLLTNEWAKKLYNGYAKDLPIFDYHCHLNAQDIWENSKFANITEAWLNGDHYKWRVMRGAGVSEEFITGNADPYEKFLQFVRAMNLAPKNPVYHWAHNELSAYFGIKEPLTEKNAEKVYKMTSELLSHDDFSVRSLIKKSKVSIIFTTDDPLGDLYYHEKLKKLEEDKIFETKVIPAYRPDKAFAIGNQAFIDYVSELGSKTGVKIDSFSIFVDSLKKCLDEFIALGTKASDHSFPNVPFVIGSKQETNDIFIKAVLNKQPITAHESELFQTSLILALASEYKKNDIVMEIHIGALRNQNASMFAKVGADTGFDAIYDNPVTYKLGRLLDLLNENDALPKTIVFPLNPADFVPVSVLLGCFADGEARGKMQLGAAWWHNDHADGIRNQLTTLSTTGVLGTFIGMLTDSRSFLSYQRHDYFRRILSSFLGECVESGEFIADLDVCSELIENISYKNAINYFSM